MKILKKIAKIVLILLATVFAFFLLLFQRIDRTPYQQTEHYKRWKSELKTIDLAKFTSEGNNFESGWAKENITPDSPMPLAGYGNRKGKDFDKVHDSIYVRSIALKTGNKTIFLVSADLLIIPPNVKEILVKNLKSHNISQNNIHFSAIHSHNSVGGWGNSIAARLFAGFYHPEEEIFLADRMLKAILNSQKDLQKSELFYGSVLDKEDIRNRLDVPGIVDPVIREILIKRSDNKTAQLVVYAAHATTLNSATFSLSRDYPGYLVDELERKCANFSMYMAGAVGSMGPIENGIDDFDEVKNQAIGVQKHLDSIKLAVLKPVEITSVLLDLPLHPAVPRMTTNYGLRTWVFSAIFGDYPIQIKYTKIGNTLFVGMPCDFSGELMVPLAKYAQSKGINLIITSFNGGYIGYVVADNHYDQKLYESTTMAWYGYQNGAYLSEVIRDLIDLK